MCPNHQWEHDCAPGAHRSLASGDRWNPTVSRDERSMCARGALDHGGAGTPSVGKAANAPQRQGRTIPQKEEAGVRGRQPPVNGDGYPRLREDMYNRKGSTLQGIASEWHQNGAGAPPLGPNTHNPPCAEQRKSAFRPGRGPDFVVGALLRWLGKPYHLCTVRRCFLIRQQTPHRTGPPWNRSYWTSQIGKSKQN